MIRVPARDSLLHPDPAEAAVAAVAAVAARVGADRRGRGLA